MRIDELIAAYEEAREAFNADESAEAGLVAAAIELSEYICADTIPAPGMVGE